MLREHKSDARGRIPNQVWKSSFSTPALRDIVPIFMVRVFADVSGRQALIHKVRQRLLTVSHDSAVTY